MPEDPVEREFDSEEENNELAPPITRRHARIRVMQALYAWDVGEQAGSGDIDTLSEHLVTRLLRENSEALAFGRELLLKSYNHRREVDELIETLAQNWEFSRIAPVDKAILRASLSELLYFPEIPTRVTINEAIEIAKTYSTEKSRIFVNGLLDAAVAKLKKEDRLQKSGRGLIGE